MSVVCRGFGTSTLQAGIAPLGLISLRDPGRPCSRVLLGSRCHLRLWIWTPRRGPEGTPPRIFRGWGLPPPFPSHLKRRQERVHPRKPPPRAGGPPRRQRSDLSRPKARGARYRSTCGGDAGLEAFSRSPADGRVAPRPVGRARLPRSGPAVPLVLSRTSVATTRSTVG